MISWQNLISEHRALSQFVKASLAISVVSLAFLVAYHMGEGMGAAAYYFFNS